MNVPLYEMTGNSLTAVPERTFTELGLQERANIQRAIRTHIEAITPGVNTMVLAEEFGDWEGANRRIDLLCLDSEARLVVVSYILDLVLLLGARPTRRLPPSSRS